MGMLSRFKDIMSANINALLDKAEDPEKMIDETLRNLNSDIGKVKAETATVMAEEQRARRAAEANAAEIAKMTEYAKKAVTAGNDDDAKQFLAKKATLTKTQESLDASLAAAEANSKKMREMYDKLTGDVAELESRREAIKSKVQMAKAQEKVNKITSSTTNAADSLSAFDRLEKKADAMLDKANAEAELNAASSSSSLDALKDKYDNKKEVADATLDAELAALKAEMNKADISTSSVEADLAALKDEMNR